MNSDLQPSHLDSDSAPWSGEFPVLERGIFFNHAAVAPLPRCSAAAMQSYAEEAAREGGAAWPHWAGRIEKGRSVAADLLGVSSDRIAFTPNTTHGLLCVANSMRWRPGDNIVIAAHEFPANVYPWKNLAERAVAVRIAPEPEDHRWRVEDFLPLIDGRTRLVSVSLVQYSTGCRMPVEALAEACRRRGALLCLDAIQAIGAMPVRPGDLGCDFLSADGHKWMLGPEGCGLFYVRREVMDLLGPAMTGWMGRAHPGAYEDWEQPLGASARRFETGALNMAGAMALASSLKLLSEVGLEQVWRRIEWLNEGLVIGLRQRGYRIVSPRGEGERSGIVSFTRPGLDAQACVARLAERRVTVSARRGWLRASLHFYNTPGQVEEFLRILDEVEDDP